MLLCFALQCAPAKMPQGDVLSFWTGFKVQVPAEACLRRFEGPDYDVFYFYRSNTDKEPLLVVYAGYGAPFPLSNRADDLYWSKEHETLCEGIRFETVHQNGLRFISGGCSNGVAKTREVLIKQDSDDRHDSSACLHCYYKSVSEADALFADSIIAAVQPGPTYNPPPPMVKKCP